MPRTLPFALLVLAACPRPVEPSAAPALPDIAMEAVTLRQYQGDRATVVVTSPRLEMMRESGDFSMADAAVRLEAQGLSVGAPRVTGNLNTGIIEGAGGLTLASADGVTGKTARARFERALGPEGGATSDAGVRLEHPDFTLEASGFSVDFASARATFEQPVTKSR